MCAAGEQSPVTQARFAATFSDVYSAPSLDVPFYITGGEPDWLGNLTGALGGFTSLPRLTRRAAAEMAFNGSALSGERWIFPNLWHTFTLTLPPADDTVQVIMLDTETLTGGQNSFPGWANVNLGYPPPAAMAGRRLLNFDISHAPPISELQWEWLGHTLGNSSATWIVVVGYDPVWSAGAYGPSWSLVERLLPMMEAAGVALYISGRDPIAQHIVPTPAGAPGVDFVGVGNGAQSNLSQAAEMPSSDLCPDGAVAFTYGAATGFATIGVTNPTGSTPAALTVTFYDASGEAIYNFSKPNPRVTKDLTAAVAPSDLGRTLAILGAGFLTAAVLLCCLASGALVPTQTKPAPTRSASRQAWVMAGETTPLVVGMTPRPPSRPAMYAPAPVQPPPPPRPGSGFMRPPSSAPTLPL